jgi:hypothetical protein
MSNRRTGRLRAPFANEPLVRNRTPAGKFSGLGAGLDNPLAATSHVGCVLARTRTRAPEKRIRCVQAHTLQLSYTIRRPPDPWTGADNLLTLKDLFGENQVLSEPVIAAGLPA